MFHIYSTILVPFRACFWALVVDRAESVSGPIWSLRLVIIYTQRRVVALIHEFYSFWAGWRPDIVILAHNFAWSCCMLSFLFNWLSCRPLSWSKQLGRLLSSIPLSYTLILDPLLSLTFLVAACRRADGIWLLVGRPLLPGLIELIVFRS